MWCGIMSSRKALSSGVAREACQIPHHRLVVDAVSRPGYQVASHAFICATSALCVAIIVAAKARSSAPAVPRLEEARGGDRFLVVRDHPREIVELADDRHGTTHVAAHRTAHTHAARHGALLSSRLAGSHHVGAALGITTACGRND